MKYALLAFCAACCVSCNNPASNNSATTDTTTTAKMHADTTAASPKNCYAYKTANDSVQLTLTTTGANVTGRLMQAFSGKDKNSGTLNGAMRGDTLLADYMFMSEGKTSVRQVAFLKRNDGFIEGYGDSKEAGGKMVFTNTGALSFSSTMVLQPVPCP